jgi:hypothetical protein
MQILSYDEAAKKAGLVLRSLERLLAQGEDPAVVHISVRRRGVLESDLNDSHQVKDAPIMVVNQFDAAAPQGPLPKGYRRLTRLAKTAGMAPLGPILRRRAPKG